MTRPNKLPEGRVAVYRAFSRAGSLLYVGITDDPRRRLLREHRKYSEWYSDADYADVRVFASRNIALLVEAAAITRENPTQIPDFRAVLYSEDFQEPEPIERFTIRLAPMPEED